jgi:MinD superfamily P-loop ATPase
VALALCAREPVRYLDCDVEAPNAHLFFKPRLEHTEPVTLTVPSVNASQCTGCHQCSQICRFNAIVVIKTQAIVFPDLCHGCGGCALVCPTGAITEVPYEIGTIEQGRAGDVTLVSGCLTVGRAMPAPIIRAVKQREDSQGLTLLDCPPGTSCPFIATIEDTDVAVLVTEPTPSGLFDLTLAVATVRVLNIPLGVVVNRIHAEENCITKYCHKENIAVLLQIPEDRQVAAAYSRGETLLSALPELRATLSVVLQKIMELTCRGIV